MNVVKFTPEHLAAMHIQEGQRWQLSVLSPAYLESLESAGPAFSAEAGGRIVACAGVAKVGWMGTLWAFVGADAGPHFIRLHRCAERILTLLPVKRIEATTEAAFLPGCRWLELLGFEKEGLMRAYGMDGADHMRYAKVWR